MDTNNLPLPLYPTLITPLLKINQIPPSLPLLPSKRIPPSRLRMLHSTLLSIARLWHPRKLVLHKRIPPRARLLRIQPGQAGPRGIHKCTRRGVLRRDAQVARVPEGVHAVAAFEEGGEARFVGGLGLLRLLLGL